MDFASYDILKEYHFTDIIIVLADYFKYEQNIRYEDDSISKIHIDITYHILGRFGICDIDYKDLFCYLYIISGTSDPTPTTINDIENLVRLPFSYHKIPEENYQKLLDIDHDALEKFGEFFSKIRKRSCTIYDILINLGLIPIITLENFYILFMTMEYRVSSYFKDSLGIIEHKIYFYEFNNSHYNENNKFVRKFRQRYSNKYEDIISKLKTPMVYSRYVTDVEYM